jgi:hypothetical protein
MTGWSLGSQIAWDKSGKGPPRLRMAGPGRGKVMYPAEDWLVWYLSHLEQPGAQAPAVSARA